jgi:putative endonuclease
VKSTALARRRAERRGRWAESLCILRLVLSGWRVLARRHAGLRGTGVGEIDLIARRGHTIAFIEVKARPDRERGVLAVSPAQQQRIARAAEAYLAHHPALADCTVRFDVMIVGAGFWPERLRDAWRP